MEFTYEMVEDTFFEEAIEVLETRHVSRDVNNNNYG